MKEKYEKLKSEVIILQKTRECNHVWNNPICEPDLFDGINIWVSSCKLCGKKITLFESFNIVNNQIKK